MSEDEDTNNSEEPNPQESDSPESQSIYLNYNQLVGIGDALKSVSEIHRQTMQTMADAISDLRLPIVDTTEILRQALANIRFVIFQPYSYNTNVVEEDEGIPQLLDKIENVITVIPEDVDESPTEEKQLRLEKTDEILDLIATLRADYESATPEDTANMSYNNKYTMVTGQTFRNQDFNMSEEYFEMMRLWNTLHSDPTFNLEVEVLRGSTDAIRLFQLFAKANNLDAGSSQIVVKELAKMRDAMDRLASQKNLPTDERQRGKSGPKHKAGDIWAWEQVNREKRPMNQVYEEWINRDDVKQRDLQEPKRHFRRIIKPAWMDK